MSVRQVVIVCSLALLAATESQAAARVFVSVDGSDMNTCSNVATPCRTFDASVAQVDSGGEVIVLTSGSYGGVIIAKSVKINAPVGIVAFTAATIQVNGPGETVVLRGLTIKALTPGIGNGILFTAGDNLQIENCVLDGWNNGIEVTGAGHITVVDTIIRNSGVSGTASAIHIDNAGALAVADHVRAIDGNNNGFGVSQGKMTVSNSLAAGNFNLGGFAQGATAEINIEKSVLANNTTRGAGVFSSGVARVSDSMVTGNGVGLLNSGGTVESFGNNAVRGNTTNTSGTITTVALQ
jgi:hypothetical protein